MLYFCLFLFAINFMLKGVYILLVPFASVTLLRKKVNMTRDLFLLLAFVAWYILCELIQFGAITMNILMIPVAYFVGLNYSQRITQEDIAKVYTVLAWGMCAHLLLNFVYETVKFGGIYYGAIHYDFWSGDYSSVTGQMLNLTMFFPLLGYAMIIRKKTLWVIPALIVGLLYGVIAGSRSVLVLLVVSIVVGAVVYIITCKKNRLKILGIGLVSVIALIVVGIIAYNANWFNIKTIWESSYLAKRFAYSQTKGESLFDTERWSTKAQYFSIITQYPWGGSNMKEQVGLYAHDLWLDTWDQVGWGPTVLISIYMVCLAWRMLRFIRQTGEAANKVLFTTYLVMLFLQLFTEPVLQGAPIFFLSACLIDGMISKYLDNSNAERQVTAG